MGIVTGTANLRLSIDINRGKPPIVSNNTGLLFHVFNSEFVDENIKPRDYSPDGNIDGYILLKAQIDLTDLRKHEKELRLKAENIRVQIEQSIQDDRLELKKKVDPKTNEFSLIEASKLRTKDLDETVDSIEVILAQLEALSSVPEDILDVTAPSFSPNISIFNRITEILTTQYPKTEWDKDFVTYYRENREFIEQGLKKVDHIDFCPFCKQILDDEALIIVQRYKEYMNNKEAKLLKEIELCRSGIDNIVNEINRIGQLSKCADADISHIKKYFPSLNNVDLLLPHVEQDDLASFKEITNMLHAKSSDLSRIFPEIADIITQVNKLLNSLLFITNNNKSLIDFVNKTKHDINGERLRLRRNLCKAHFIRLKDSLSPLFNEQTVTETELKMLEEEIQEKEQIARISKRDKFFETLTRTLEHFFSNKFTFDKESFQLRFLGNKIEKASKVLSDGEKSIVAFCVYLASTHLLIKSESDYNKLFFVIDDPISSMDFDFVFAETQILRDLDKIFNISGHIRIWLLTHNLEFFSILTRNGIICQSFLMKPGSIEYIKYQLLMPYENHLRDIITVAKGGATTHTTANSIRHVLETVCQFEYPDLGIEKYIQMNEILAKEPSIYTICNDLSHGGLRNQPAITPDALKTACKSVIVFMGTKFQGQIDAALKIYTD